MQALKRRDPPISGCVRILNLVDLDAIWSQHGHEYLELIYPRQVFIREMAKVEAVPQGASGGGAYTLHLEVSRALRIQAGSLGEIRLASGLYFYIGSARRGIAARVARHERLARTKAGQAQWHVDYLLLHPSVRLLQVEAHRNQNECRVSKRIARRQGVTAPIARFGSTDCRSGCKAHLYRIPQAHPK